MFLDLSRLKKGQSVDVYLESEILYLSSQSWVPNLRLNVTRLDWLAWQIRPIDKKLEYQIEKLLKAGQTLMSEETGEEAAKEDALAYRPNPDMLVSKLDQMVEVKLHLRFLSGVITYKP